MVVGAGALVWLSACKDAPVPAQAAEEGKKQERPQVPVVQKDGRKAARRCFRDANKDGYCDNGTEQQGKCKNNCRSAESIGNEQKAQGKGAAEPSLGAETEQGASSWSAPCSGCPLAGACKGKCIAWLSPSFSL